MRVIGYTRVSTQEQASDGMSLNAQEHRIRAWAEGVGAELTDVIREEGVSGSKLLGERPGGAKIAKLLESRRPEVEAVVTVRMDRLGRDAAEQLALLKRFRNGKVGVVALSQQIDLATPHGRAMAGVSAVFNQLERELIAERTSETLADLRRQGRVWNHPPFGWKVGVVTQDDGRKEGWLVEDPEEQATLAVISGLRVQGQSFHKIAATLNATGRPAKRGGPWYAMSVRSVLASNAKVGSAEEAKPSDVLAGTSSHIVGQAQPVDRQVCARPSSPGSLNGPG